MIIWTLLRGAIERPLIQHQFDKHERELIRQREEHARECQARDEAKNAEIARIDSEFQSLRGAEEKYAMVLRCVHPSTPSNATIPTALMRQWWDKTGWYVRGWRQSVEKYTRAKSLIEQNGMVAIRHGPYRKELQGILPDSWTRVSQDVLFYRIDRSIEIDLRCLAGEDRSDVLDDIAWREEREGKSPEPAPNDDLGDDIDTETLAQRLRKLPRVQSLQARIEKTPDSKSILLFLNLSQHERAVVAQHGLDEIVYDDEPAHSKEELDAIQAGYDEEIADMQEVEDDDDTSYDRERREAIAERKREISAEMRELKAKRRKYTLIDYLKYPSEKEFASRHEATLYADKLQKIVVKIRDDIKRYEDIDDTRIFKGDQQDE